MHDKITLTQQKIDQLKQELDKLENVKRKELSESLEQARLSDVSEDTDDIIAVMSEMEKVDQRVGEIKEILASATVMKKGSCSNGKITVGCTVKLQVGKKTVTYDIVAGVESDPTENKISDDSPLGKAIMKAKVGDTVKVGIGDRTVEYKILEIC